MPLKSRKLTLGLVAALFAVATAFIISRAPRKEADGPRPPKAVDSRLPGPAEEPIREYDANHQMARVKHKDPNGLSPLELVNTPGGVVTVQRTFNADGVLLKEEAFLDGKSVPVPSTSPAAK
jgi:hypothetical protein